MKEVRVYYETKDGRSIACLDTNCVPRVGESIILYDDLDIRHRVLDVCYRYDGANLSYITISVEKIERKRFTRGPK